MQAATTHQTDVLAVPARIRGGLLHQYMELGKARLTALVLVTAGVGYVMGARGDMNWSVFAWLIIGTALAAVELLTAAGAEIVGACFVVDLPDLGGADKLKAAGVPVSTLVAFGGH